MSLCPRCEFDVGDTPAEANCPRCGVRIGARRRSLSGFSLPVANLPSSPAPAITSRPPPPSADDSWGISDDEKPSKTSPQRPSAQPSGAFGASVFRAPTHAAPRPPSAASSPVEPLPPSGPSMGSTTQILGEDAVAEAFARYGEGSPLAPTVPAEFRGGAGRASRSTLVQAGPAATASRGIHATLMMTPPSEAATPAATATRASSTPTPLGVGVGQLRTPLEPPAGARGVKSTLVMSSPLRQANPAPTAPTSTPTPTPAPTPQPVPAPPRAPDPDRAPGQSTLVMPGLSPVAPPVAEPRGVRSTLVMSTALPPPAEPPRGAKSTLVMTPEVRGASLPVDPRPRPRPPPPQPARVSRPRLDLRAPSRGGSLVPPPEADRDDELPTPDYGIDPVTVIQHQLTPPEPEGDPQPPLERDTIDPLAMTQPVDDLMVADVLAPAIASSPAAPEPVVEPEPELPAPPAPPAPPAHEAAIVSALVSQQKPVARAPREDDRATTRLRRIAGVAAAALAAAPWFAALRPFDRGVSLAGAALAALAAFAPLKTGLRASIAVAGGAVLLGVWLARSTDLSVLGLALTLALLLVLPGGLFHRSDRPESARGSAVVSVGLLLGAAWILAPAAGGALELVVPLASAHDYATVSLAPWLALGLMSIPRATAAASGTPFAAGVLLWSGALALLRAQALSVEGEQQWRAVIVTGVCAAALASVLSGGVAAALSDDEG